MAIAISITRARITGGRVSIVWSDGTTRDWPSVADFMAEQNLRVFSNVDLLKEIALALIAVRAPQLSDPSQFEGRTLTLDPTIANVLRVS